MAIDWDPQVERTSELRELASESGAYLAIAYFVRTSEHSLRNEATVISPQDEFLEIYGKDHPVRFNGELDTSLGIYPVYDTPLGRLATIICYDMDFTDTSRKMAQAGAQVIAAPSLDAPAIATRHYAHLVFQAIENRVSLIKSDSSGSDSAIIDLYRRILEKAVTPTGGEAVLVSICIQESSTRNGGGRDGHFSGALYFPS
jgi:apolipoprotein N-acyltransferase